MNEPIVALPGFTVPGTPNADERIVAQPDGTIVWDVIVVEDKNVLPLLELWLSSEFGAEKIKRLVLDPKQVSLLNAEDPLGQRVIRATISAASLGATTPPCSTAVSGRDRITIEPGTYRLRALLAGLQIAEKWVTVQATPQNAAWLGVNKFNDYPVVLKPDTTP